MTLRLRSRSDDHASILKYFDMFTEVGTVPNIYLQAKPTHCGIHVGDDGKMAELYLIWPLHSRPSNGCFVQLGSDLWSFLGPIWRLMNGAESTDWPRKLE